MKNLFYSYYPKTEEDFRILWQNCFFILDANILLNIYRYSEETREEFFTLLEKIAERIWIPNQVALEYHKNRLVVISDQTKAYDVIQNSVLEINNKLEGTLKTYKKHPFIKINDLLEKVASLTNEIQGELAKRKSEHPELLFDDVLMDRLTTLFENKVGLPYSDDKLIDIYSEGLNRFESKIPPGYEDAKDKKGNDQYGDLVLWYQIIDKAKEVNKPIIFITDDSKEDWWFKFEGKTIGPRREIIEEIKNKSNVTFHMYKSDQFMKYAQDYIGGVVKKETIQEAQDIREQNEENTKVESIKITPIDFEEIFSKIRKDFTDEQIKEQIEKDNKMNNISIVDQEKLKEFRLAYDKFKERKLEKQTRLNEAYLEYLHDKYTLNEPED